TPTSAGRPRSSRGSSVRLSLSGRRRAGSCPRRARLLGGDLVVGDEHGLRDRPRPESPQGSAAVRLDRVDRLAQTVRRLLGGLAERCPPQHLKLRRRQPARPPGGAVAGDRRRELLTLLDDLLDRRPHVDKRIRDRDSFVVDGSLDGDDDDPVAAVSGVPREEVVAPDRVEHRALHSPEGVAAEAPARRVVAASCADQRELSLTAEVVAIDGRRADEAVEVAGRDLDQVLVLDHEVGRARPRAAAARAAGLLRAPAQAEARARQVRHRSVRPARPGSARLPEALLDALRFRCRACRPSRSTRCFTRTTRAAASTGETSTAYAGVTARLSEGLANL